MIAKFAKILRVTGRKTGVGVLIFDINWSRIGIGFCNFGAGLESESQKKRLRTSLQCVRLSSEVIFKCGLNAAYDN